jgi:hypothetical protein
MKHFRNHLFSVAGVAAFLFLAFATIPTDNRNNRSSSPNTTRYVNSRSSFSGELADNYVEFSFDYPSSWKRDSKAGTGDSSNFVKVQNNTADNFTLENFAVGYFTGQKAFMPQLATQLSEQFSRGFPEYKKVSEGETRIGSYDGYEFRFTSHAKDLDIWGRIVLLPGESGGRGVVLVMLASSASRDVHGVEDVGEKGELPIIIKSFRFGS